MFSQIHFLVFGLICCELVLLALSADTNYLRSTIQNHFSANRHHLVDASNKEAAKEFVKAEFTRFGLDVITQNFVGSGHADLNGRTFTNVIGILKGARFGTESDTIVGVGAHYDTVTTTKGVDDNGAGVAAMLETARRMTSDYTDVQNTVIFAAFDIEEYLFSVDGIGSQKLVNDWLPGWLQQNYGDAVTNLNFHGVIVLETVMNFDSSKMSQEIPGTEAVFQQAFPNVYSSIKSDGEQGDFLAVIYRKPTDDAKLASILETSWHKGGNPEFQVEMLGLDLTTNVDLNDRNYENFLRSDHYHFWKGDLTAIFITDSADYRGLMKNCYHKECDNIEQMLTDENVNFLGKIADAVTDTVGTLSEGKTQTSGVTTLKMSAYLITVLLMTTLL